MEKNDFLFGMSYILFIFAFESQKIKVKSQKAKVKG